MLPDLKVCSECKVPQPILSFPQDVSRLDGRYPYCRPCARERKRISVIANPVSPEKRREYAARYKARHPDRVSAKDHRRNLRRKYGMTEQSYDALLALQNGVCAVCKGSNPSKRLAVDHDHETGEVRGLLCSNCNTALGLLQDSPENLTQALIYLKREKQ